MESDCFNKRSSGTSLAPVNFIYHYEQFLLVGEGSALTVFREQTLESVVTKQIFEAQNAYGIRPVVTCARHFIVFGNRFQRRVELVEDENDAIDVHTIGPSERLGDWIWDLKVFDDFEVVLVSHNRLIFIENETRKRYVDCAVRCIIYSGCIVANAQDNILVASGTVFNEVLLWNGTSGDVWHRLEGHDGVIFSVTISTRDNVLISTSDDRSARIFKLHQDSDFNRPASLTEDAFVETAACYGHSSRVWKACVWNSEVFATVGEDGNLCLWRLADGSLLARKQMPFKSSIASISIRNNVAYLGGAYGCFVAVRLDELIDTDRSRRSIVALPRLDDVGGGVVKNVTIDRGNLVANDSKGNYGLHFMQQDNITWNSRFLLEECRNYSVMGHIEGFLFTGCNLGIVVSFAITESEFVAWDTQQIHSGQIFSVVPFINHKTNQLYVLTSGLSGSMCCSLFCQQQKSLLKLISLALPLAQQRWATCAVHYKFSLIVVGDRQGNVALYSICPRSMTTRPRSILSHLHGNKGTTDLQHFQDRILSSGRNGCIYELDVQHDTLVVLRRFWLHSPMSWIAKLLVYNNRLIVAGFIADDFVVCDPESDDVLWSVTAKCASHRPWACSIYSDTLFFATLNRVDGRVIYECVDIRQKLATVARVPLHRKKINCVKPLWTEPERTVLVTGGEDNLVIISEVRQNQIRPVVRLYEHISSVKGIDSAELHNGDRLLVTCGGRAQLNVWRVSVDLSVKLLDEHFVWNPDRSSKGKASKCTAAKKLDPLTRYMAVGLRHLSTIEATSRFQIVTACSDGEIRLFDYELNGKLQIVKHLNSSDFCQQQSVWLAQSTTADLHFSNVSPASDVGVYVNAATNGVLSCYDTSELQEALAESVVPVHQSGINAIAVQNNLFATGGDDNALVVTQLVPVAAAAATAAATAATAATAAAVGKEYSCSSSADSELAEIKPDRSRFQFEVKARIEKAHSAQITSVHWWTDKILMTAAVDQRISWWKLNDDFTLETFAQSSMTWIADVSGSMILGNNDVLIIGQGAQIFRPPDEALVKAREKFLKQTIETTAAPPLDTTGETAQLLTGGKKFR